MESHTPLQGTPRPNDPLGQLVTPNGDPFVSNRSPRSKKLLIIIISIVVGIVLLAGAALWWASQEKQAYATAAKAYEGKLNTAYAALEEQPGDTTAYLVYLEKHHKTLSQILDSQPKAASILGITAAPEDALAQTKKLTEATQKLQTALQQYRAFLVYRDGLLLAVKGSGGKVGTIDEMKSAKGRLEAAVTTIKSLKPPKGLESYHQKQIDAYTRPIADIKAAVSAFEDGDMLKYSDAVIKLAEDAKSISLHITSRELLDMHQYYDAMTDAYDELGKLLK